MKSFSLSFILLTIICVYVVSLFNVKRSEYYNSFPDWVFIVVISIFFIGFMLTLYWGITGILKRQFFLNLMRIDLSLFGLALYVFSMFVDRENGQETPGQFDHALGQIETHQQAAVTELLEQTNTKQDDVQMVAYWKMYKNPGEFVLCVQQGNIIALQVRNKMISDVRIVSPFKQLNSDKKMLLYQEALQNNTSFMGVKLAIIPDKGYMYAIAEIDIEGMDYDEFKLMISDLGYWADQLDDIFIERFGSSVAMN